MSQSKSPSVRLRPGDRVRNYILSQEEKPGGGRLPTMRDLAVHLKVSLATVQSVYRALKNEGRIITRAGDGTYIAAAPPPASTKKRLFLNHLPRVEGGYENRLANTYYGAILQAMSQGETRFDLSILDAGPHPENQARALFASGELDAMLIIPFTPCQPLIDTCDAEGIPYATIHPGNPLTCSNFVSPDFFGAGCRIGEAIQAGGRKRVAILSLRDLQHSSTGPALLGGIITGALQDQSSITFDHAHFRHSPDMREAMRQWLHERRHALPDLFICHRPHLHATLLELLAAMKVSVPGDASVISMLHSPQDNAATGLTQFVFDFDAIGDATIRLLLRRMEQGNEPLPGEKHPVTFIGGATTIEAENRVLGIFSSVK